MSRENVAAHVSGTDTYSPRLRTALVLTGTGTAGAYHAGVLRALDEAGVKLDVVAGQGIGAVSALFAAVDGAERLWADKGFWRAPAVHTLYPWRSGLRIAALTLAVALAIVAVPIAAVALGLVVFPIDFLLKLIGLGGAGGLVAGYVHAAQAAFAASALPTWLPRLVVIALATAGGVVLANGLRHEPIRSADAWWWRALTAPLSSGSAIDHTWRMLWELIRGATPVRQPAVTDLGRRYADMLAENLGQPGFRELLIIAHDVDVHRDLVFALVAEPRRREMVRRATTAAGDARRAELLDLTGLGRDHLPDAVAAALTLPLATEWHRIAFMPDEYWRGETHRLCDRPSALIRLIDELIDLGVEQIVLASAAPEAPGPHTLTSPRADGRGRLGEYLQSSEAAVVRDATTTTAGVRIFTIRPAHNAIGPFDFGGGFDDRSRRRQPLAELLTLGYEDAYRQFIDPVVGASGERIQSAVASRRPAAGGHPSSVTSSARPLQPRRENML
jgi:Patatin-like phospholipase